MTVSIVSAAKQCRGQCFCDFSWPFPHGHKIAAFFSHIAFPIKAGKRRTGRNGSIFLLSGKQNFLRRSPLHPANLLLRPYVDYIFPFPSCQEGLKSESRTIMISLPYTMPPKLRFLEVWKMKDIDNG